jgi:hypothetical protein
MDTSTVAPAWRATGNPSATRSDPLDVGAVPPLFGPAELWRILSSPATEGFTIGSIPEIPEEPEDGRRARGTVLRGPLGTSFLARTRLPGRDQACDPFASASDPNARQIISENPDFYDRTLPPSAIQVIFVNVNMLNRKAPDQLGQHDRFIGGLDMAALAELTMRQ